MRCALQEALIIQPCCVALQVVSVMDIPGLGTQAAKKVCDDMKIRTQGDSKLEEAKKLVYLKGFNEGVMIVGNHAGEKVTLHRTLPSSQSFCGDKRVGGWETRGGGEGDETWDASLWNGCVF